MNFQPIHIRQFLLESLPSRFQSLSLPEFEELLRYLLEVDGYVMEPIVANGQLPNVIKASKEEVTLVVLSFRNHPDLEVGIHEVQKAIYARMFYKTSQSWIITTSSFTSEAVQLAEDSDIELWGWDALYNALCQLFFEGKNHVEYMEAHSFNSSIEKAEPELRLKAKWKAAEGVSAEWYNLEIILSNPTDRNIYIHLELPALIDRNKNQVMAEDWAEGDFVAGMIYSGASVRTNALFSVFKLGDRPPGGRIVLTCHERQDLPLTYHLNARLQGEACFIITYCYSRQSLEYKSMISYRDMVLSQSFAGRRIIEFYYLVSPLLVNWAKHNQAVDSFVRKFVAWIIPYFLKRFQKQISQMTYLHKIQ